MQDLIRLWTSLGGRATRADYWQRYVLVALVGVIVVLPLEAVTGLHTRLMFVWWLALLWPGFAVGFKRYHDRGKSGRAFAILYAVMTVTYVGWMLTVDHELAPGELPGRVPAALAFSSAVVSLYLLVAVGFRKGQPGPNQYGPDPLNRDAQPVQDP